MAGNRKYGFMRGVGKGTTKKDVAESIYINVSFKVEYSGLWKGDIFCPRVKSLVKKELIEKGFKVAIDRESGDLVVTKKEACHA